MIYVFSNRNIESNNWLGDGFNTVGNDNLRVAKMESDGMLNFYEEHENEKLPSLKVIEEVEDSDKPCCIFIHGFNQDLEKNLSKCKEIESYGVNVIAFSWPSNPGPQQWWGKLKEYRSAQKNARRSTMALERFFDKLSDYHSSTVGIKNIRSLVVHSLGNFLLQSFVSGLGYEQQVRFLNNILLHQADVDSVNHEKWADSLANNCRVLTTVNETDNTLDFSDIINPDRLGNTLENLNSNIIKYFNFGRIPEADDKHRLWIPPTTDNSEASNFFKSVFTGKKVKTGHIEYDNKRNCFHIK